MMAPSHINFVVILIAIVLLIYRVLRTGRRPAGYPPGPPTLPVLGNIHQMPTHDAHKQFQKWAIEYGPIYSLILGSKIMVVLSSDTAVKDLLDKKSAIYSDRPDMYVGQTLCSGDLRFVMMKYGPTLRMMRKMSHSLLNKSAALSYTPYQLFENKQMLYELLERPEHFLESIRRYSMSLTTSIIFGWRTPTYDDPQLKQLFEGFNEMATLANTGTAALVDCFPPLRWIPDWANPTKAKAKELHKHEKKYYMSHWLNAKNSIKTGTSRPCFCTDMAKTQQQEGFSDDLAGYISGSLLEAGSDTTTWTLYAFVQAMLVFQDVQKAAQAEIDRVVGSARLPDVDDEPNLQYIRGCVKESLRWMPVAILGFPHAVSQDDEYLGYHIPKGATVVNNVYTIHHDPARYPNPRNFDPSRFKDDFQSVADSAANPDVSKRDQFVFGAGRRLCQGMHVAERSLFLGISRLLWAFDIKPALDPKGEPIIPDTEKLTQGFTCGPEPFLARIVPRSRERAEIVRNEWEEAQRLLDPVSMQWK